MMIMIGQNVTLLSLIKAILKKRPVNKKTLSNKKPTVTENKKMEKEDQATSKKKLKALEIMGVRRHASWRNYKKRPSLCPPTGGRLPAARSRFFPSRPLLYMSVCAVPLFITFLSFTILPSNRQRAV